jgi:hypothetical protein
MQSATLPLQSTQHPLGETENAHLFQRDPIVAKPDILACGAGLAGIDASRVTATAMGQAAGTAAALAVAKKRSPRDISITHLQEQLLAAGAILEAPHSDINPGNPTW